MAVDILLNALRKVRRTANGEWVACCPAHDDKSPSLAIKQADDRILVHCFAGCTPDEITRAVGLKLSDLMPERLTDTSLPRMPWNPRTVLEAVYNNAMILSVMASDASYGKKLTPADRDKMHEMAAEIQEAVKYATR